LALPETLEAPAAEPMQLESGSMRLLIFSS